MRCVWLLPQSTGDYMPLAHLWPLSEQARVTTYRSFQREWYKGASAAAVPSWPDRTALLLLLCWPLGLRRRLLLLNLLHQPIHILVCADGGGSGSWGVAGCGMRAS